MTPAYTAKLDLRLRPTNVGTHKIDDSAPKTYGMISVSFLLQDSQERVWFFEKTFLLADTSIEVILEMPFLVLSNADVKFTELEKLT